MKIQAFFDQRTSTLTYVVHDEETRTGVVIDSVTDYDPKSGRIWHESAEKVYGYVEEQRLRIPFVIDTHAHADHLSGMQYFKQRCASRTVIGTHITSVQERFRDLYNLGSDFPVDGRQFDVLFEEGQVLEAGPLRIEACHTPGHTPACMTYRIGTALFVGDVLFMPDYGTARCDFPGGSAERLYESIRRLYELPGETEVFTCHDYQPGDRELRFQTTIEEERSSNIQLKATTPRDDFVAFRKERDATLEMPTLILPSLQVNIRAGRLPEAEDNGVSYLKIPLNQF